MGIIKNLKDKLMGHSNGQVQLTPEQEKEMTARAQFCMAEVKKVLEQYNCELAAQTLIVGGNIKQDVIFLPKLRPTGVIRAEAKLPENLNQ